MDFKAFTSRAALACALLFTINAFAANDELAEYQRRMKQAEVVGALGADMFGDSVNYYNGTVSFSVTDIDLPGNDSLPVRVARTFNAAHSDEPTPSAAFGDWELDLPYMKGVFAADAPWQVFGASPTNRCSGTTTQLPATVQYLGATFTGNQYWRGNVLHVPGVGNQNVLRSACRTGDAAPLSPPTLTTATASASGPRGQTGRSSTLSTTPPVRWCTPSASRRPRGRWSSRPIT